MTEQIKEIAARIGDLREISGLSIETLSLEFGISQETYRQYESGAADIPVGFLYKLANKFKVDLTEILTGDSPKLHTYCLVRKNKGVSMERREQYKYQSLAYNFAHKKADPFMVTVAPDLENKPIDMNTHPGQEFNYVLEGSLKVVIDGHELVLKEGDSLFFDSEAPHGMKALEGKAAKFLAIIF